MARRRLEPNALRFVAGSGRGHLESYFVKANDAKGERAIWIRATIFAADSEPERVLAEGWAIAFDRRGGVTRHAAVKRVVPFETARFRVDDLDVSWDGGDGARLSLDTRATKGELASKDHRVAWDLRYENTAAPIIPYFSDRMYTAGVPRQKILTPAPDARFSGIVQAFGETWELDGWRGMQGHNWGRGHAERYAWAHVNQWETPEDFVLEGFSAQISVGPVLAPLTTIVCVRHEGVAFDFTSPMELLRARGDVGLRRWDFVAKSDRAIVEGNLEAATEDFVGLYYPNPDGAMTYCLNSKLARARVHFEAKGRAPMTLTSRAAALEIATRDDAHGVRMQA